MKNKFFKIISFSILFILCITFVSRAAENEYTGSKKFEDFLDKKISINIGSIYELFLKEKMPNAKIVSLIDNSDMITALLTKKIDVMTCEKTVFFEFHKVDKNYKYIPESIGNIAKSFVLSDDICEENNGIFRKELNEFIKESKENGFIDSIIKKWCENDNVNYEPYKNPNPKKIIKVAMNQIIPYVYLKDGEYVGFEIEILETFAKKYNYGIEYEMCPFASVMMGIEMNRYDVGIGAITVTEERKKSMNFIDVYFEDEVVLVYYENTDNKKVENKSLEDFSDKKILIVLGSVYSSALDTVLPNATQIELNEVSDICENLKAKKADATALEKITYYELFKEDTNYKYIDKSLAKISQAYIMSEDICKENIVNKELNDFIKESKENGFIDSVIDKWTKEDSSKIHYENYKNNNPKRVLKVAINSFAPYSYIRDNQYVGFDIEIIETFAKKYNYGIEYEICQFSSELVGVSSNKYDIGIGSITPTEERKKSLNFTDIYFEDDIVLVYYETEEENNKKLTSKSLEDFSDKKIAAQMGTTNAEIIDVVFPNAKAIKLNEISDLLENLKSKKADAMCVELTTYYELLKEDKNIKYIDKSLEDVPQAFIISNKILQEGIVNKQLNDFIKESKENGFLDEIIKKWTLEDTQNIQYKNYTNPNPTRVLKVATNIYAPYVYLKDNNFVGIDIELIEAFAKKYNYGIEYENTMFSSVLAGVSMDKYDIGIGGITYTEERSKNIYFTDTYFNDKTVLVYYENDENNILCFSKIKDSFYNSFIKEDRYLLILQGILNTIIITISSVFGGILLGFILYLFFRKNIKFVNWLLNLYSYIINGMPFLVLLLVLYYVVFSNNDMSGIIISILAFILTFSIFIFESLVTFVGIIDKGQIEAAYSLGFTDRKTFFKVLLPQSILRIFPSFKGEIISLLKSTSIVGYIAVTDLTRAGDLIRSRTYEAFFPIISIAIIYFILGAIFKTILSIIEKKINPKNRTKKEIMAGVIYDI